MAVGLLIAPMPPCITIPRAGTRVSGDVKVCPGTYRIPDPREQGVLIVTASDTRLDLSGVTLESGDSVPSRFVGTGVAVQGSDRVMISGGRIRGYRWGIRVDGGSGHRIEDLALSGSRAQALLSTPLKYDEGDWLDIFHPDSTLAYGGGLVLLDADRATVLRVHANGAQNGIALIRTTRS
ncbi:MAG TPA: hypothetical protein VG940_03765, partial [Gemmatimonadales bacterium]|nr:hypothetical protein [Gemmatimonadales bacterium]